MPVNVVYYSGGSGGSRCRLAKAFWGYVLPSGLSLCTRRQTPAFKGVREQDFPLELLEQGYEIRVEDGQASQEKDRKRILNSIAAKPLESEPDLHHPAYGEVNQTLRSMVAAHGIGRSARAGQLEKAIAVVCGDRNQTKLELNLSWCDALDDVAPLAKLGELQSLQQLTLVLARCEALVDVASLATW